MTDKTEGDGERRWEIRQSLVERLRIPWEGMGDMANQQRTEAAIQISTMMDEIEELRGMLEVASEMAEHYAQERDEARRLVCRHTKKRYRTLREMAEGRGWDCFKEKP